MIHDFPKILVFRFHFRARRVAYYVYHTIADYAMCSYMDSRQASPLSPTSQAVSWLGEIVECVLHGASESVCTYDKPK